MPELSTFVWKIVVIAGVLLLLLLPAAVGLIVGLPIIIFGAVGHHRVPFEKRRYRESKPSTYDPSTSGHDRALRNHYKDF